MLESTARLLVEFLLTSNIVLSAYITGEQCSFKYCGMSFVRRILRLSPTYSQPSALLCLFPIHSTNFLLSTHKELCHSQTFQGASSLISPVSTTITISNRYGLIPDSWCNPTHTPNPCVTPATLLLITVFFPDTFLLLT